MEDAETIRERVLVARCQAGDRAAFEEIVGLFQARLRYFVEKLVGDRGAADDVLQEVWFEAYRGLPKLRDSGAFRAWLYRVARDRAYTSLRRAGPRAVPMEEGLDVAAPEGPEERFSAEDAGVVHACLDEVPAEQREALVLRFLEEMSYEEIARVAGCNVGTVRSRLHYGKRALRAAIERKRRTS